MADEQDKPSKKRSQILETSLELSKWIIGTVGLGIAGIYINKNIQETELQIKRVEADTNLLQTVTNNIENNQTDSLELRYLSFVKTFITTSEIKNEVIDRIDELRYNLSLIAKKEAELKNDKQVELAKNQIDDIQREKLIKEESEVERNNNEKVSIEDLKLKEKSIATNVVSIDSSTIETISSTQKVITPVTISKDEETYKLTGLPITKWCKKGYYVEFNNTLRIGINDLNNQSIDFNIKDIDGERTQPKLIKDKVSLVAGETYKITINDYQYEITLSYIGSAGRNPFSKSKAAYLTVSTYIRQLNKAKQ